MTGRFKGIIFCPASTKIKTTAVKYNCECIERKPELTEIVLFPQRCPKHNKHIQGVWIE